MIRQACKRRIAPVLLGALVFYGGGVFMAQGQAAPASATVLHAARLLDLLDRARVNDIDTTGWVPAAVMAVVIASAADTE